MIGVGEPIETVSIPIVQSSASEYSDIVSPLTVSSIVSVPAPVTVPSNPNVALTPHKLVVSASAGSLAPLSVPSVP